LWQKSSKFTKNVSWHGLHKSEFSRVHFYARNWSSKTSVDRTWFELREVSLNTKFKPKHTRISFNHPNYIAKYCRNTVDDTMILGVSQPSHLTEISSRDMEGVPALTGIANSRIFPHYDKIKSRWWEWTKSYNACYSRNLVQRGSNSNLNSFRIILFKPYFPLVKELQIF
jgi:hypothetical protein